MTTRHSRSRRGVAGALWALLIGLALGVAGLVAWYQSTEVEEGMPAPAWLGVPLETPLPGIVLLLLGIALAFWAIRAMYKVGSREPRTQVPAWLVQPPPGAKEFGNPPHPQSHRAELAAAGLEAVRLSGDLWHVRRMVR